MLTEYFITAFRSIMTHKVRSLLTMLGVIIGVSSVILLISLGYSAKLEAANQIRGLGSNLVMVSVNDRQNILSKIWLDEIKESAKIDTYSPIFQGSTYFNTQDSNFRVAVRGVNQDFSYITSLKLTAGRFFTDIDIENNLPVTVIGTKVVSNLFGDSEPLGETIIIKGIPFEVIGILEEQGMSFNGDQDIIAYIPYEYASRLFGLKTQKTYYVASVSEDNTEATRSKIELYLSRRITPASLYEVYSQTQMLEILDEIMAILTILLAGIASISLLVGGIGIMNIMLVTVRERTREIGIRKALGARRSYIMLQFLTEAILITVIGGSIGLLFSMAGARIITVLTGFTVVTGMSSIALAISFSTAIGLIFGIYPASKASRLVPVDALRFE